jgi:hypothetical protein
MPGGRRSRKGVKVTVPWGTKSRSSIAVPEREPEYHPTRLSAENPFPIQGLVPSSHDLGGAGQEEATSQTRGEVTIRLRRIVHQHLVPLYRRNNQFPSEKDLKNLKIELEFALLSTVGIGLEATTRES